MGSSNSDDKFPSEKLAKSTSSFPEIFVDHASDFASIKIKSGIESKSYIKDGVVVSEDSHGEIIEIQILNVSAFKAQKSAS